ncbi:MAG: hypothetical protein ACUVXI_10650 [bacterium]
MFVQGVGGVANRIQAVGTEGRSAASKKGESQAVDSDELRLELREEASLAARVTIRDLDSALELLEAVRNDIMSDASRAVSAQSNVNPYKIGQLFDS